MTYSNNWQILYNSIIIDEEILRREGRGDDQENSKSHWNFYVFCSSNIYHSGMQ